MEKVIEAKQEKGKNSPRNAKNEKTLNKSLNKSTNKLIKSTVERSSSRGKYQSPKTDKKLLLQSKVMLRNKSVEKIVKTGEDKRKSKEDVKVKMMNPIPKDIKGLIEFIRGLMANEPLQKHFNNSPPKNTSTYEDMAKYLATYSKNEVEIFFLIYLWVCNNVAYDATSYFAGTHPDGSAQNVFKTGLSVCEGYANLYQAMCNSVGLRCEKVSGYAKGASYKAGQSCSTANHAWNVITCFGSQYIVDSTWGAGNLNTNDKKFEKRLSPFYFLSPPEVISASHRPTQDKFQLLNRPIPLKQFESKSKVAYTSFYPAVYEKSIDLLTHYYPEINHNSKELQIKIGVKNLTIMAKLSTEDGVDLPNFVNTNSDTVNGLHTFNIAFEKNGVYELNVFYKSASDPVKGDTYTSFLKYIINLNIVEVRNRVNKHTSRNAASLSPTKLAKKYVVNNTNSSNMGNTGENFYKTKTDTLICPSKPKCFDNSGFYLFEPKNPFLKIGVAIKFRVKVKGAINVVVLDYKAFNYLKRKGDDIWEGTINIKTGFVTILSQKSSSLFTEVHEFTNFK